MANNQKRSDDEMRHETRFATPSTPSGTSGTDVEAGLPLEAQGLIGHQLRQEYRRLLSEPLPDKFTKLLDALAHSEGKPESKSESNE